MGTIFKSKVYGSVSINDKGEIIIPSRLRKALNIKIGDEFVILGEFNTDSIYLMPIDGFRKLLKSTSEILSKLKEAASN